MNFLPYLGTAATIVSAVCAAIGTYISLRIRAELAERENRLLEKLDGRYVMKEVFDERCPAMHPAPRHHAA